MLDERFTITLADGSPFTLTTAWWHNAAVTRRRVVGGERREETAWFKHLSHGGRGWYERVVYGQPQPRPLRFGGRCADPRVEAHDGHGHQVAVICCRASRLLAVDVDDEAAYLAGAATARLVTREHAVTTRGGGWHAYVAVPEALLGRWPRQGPIPGGDVKACGFVPMPGCWHHSGEPYAPVPGGEVLVADASLLEALRADRAAREAGRVVGSGDGGERGEGNEPTLFSHAGALYAAGYGVEEAWAAWLELAGTLTLSDPAWPWTEADRDVFDRQWAYCEAQHAANHGPQAAVNAAAGARGGSAEDAPRGGQAPAEGDDGGAGGGGPTDPPGPPSPPWEDGVAGGGDGEDDDDGWDATEAARHAALPPVAPAPDDPLAVARYLAAAWAGPDDAATLAHWRDSWLRWTGSHWAETSERAVRNEVYRAMEDKGYLSRPDGQGNRHLVAWQPTAPRVGNVVDAMRATLEVADDAEPDTWHQPRRGGALPGDWDRLVPCRNALVHPGTRTVIRHSPRYLNLHALPFDHDPQATCPRWRAFLEAVFPRDEASVALLQEWFGYVLGGGTSMQRMMFLVGATRGGKGVTSRVLAQLLGERAVAGPTLSSFASNFGLSSLVDKPLAVIADARSSGKVDTQAVIERLLAITGEDRVDVDRKNRPIWTGKLPTRVMMLSNELPWFRDASAAIARRMLVLVYRQSFAGREDHTLEDALTAELAGILNWSLDGLARVTTTRRFTEPEASRDVTEELAREVSPMGDFLAERCRLGVGLTVPRDDLFLAWLAWGGDERDDRAARTRFGHALRAAMPGLTSRLVTLSGGRRGRVYEGVALAS